MMNQTMTFDTLRSDTLLTDTFAVENINPIDSFSLNSVDVFAMDTVKADTINSAYIPIVTSGSDSGMDGIELPYRLSNDDGITAILLFCFLLSAYVLAGAKRVLIQQFKDFFYVKERSSIFLDSTVADFRYQFFLLLQTCILIGVCFFDYFHDTVPALHINYPSYILLAIYIGGCIIYYLLKWLLYSFLNWTFFDKMRASIFMESYHFIISVFGLFLFPVVLLAVYFDLSATILIPIILGMVVFAKILVFYKSVKLFFDNLYGLLLLILYFCALEIMPVFILYRTFDQINNLLLIKL